MEKSRLVRAIMRCEPIHPISLFDYVRDYFSKSEKELAIMPGTPSQVMAAQFVLHARLSCELAEVYFDDTEVFDKLAEIIGHCPCAR